MKIHLNSHRIILDFHKDNEAKQQKQMLQQQLKQQVAQKQADMLAQAQAQAQPTSTAVWFNCKRGFRSCLVAFDFEYFKTIYFLMLFVF